jgi:hypothetical protein
MMPEDPFQYVGRLSRDANGKPVSLEIFGPGDEITISQGDEFITFTTVTSLEERP